jgi:hypothetical protein
MLLNEFLKEHRRVSDQSEQIAQLNATVKELKSAFKAQEALLHNVSDQLARRFSRSGYVAAVGDIQSASAR